MSGGLRVLFVALLIAHAEPRIRFKPSPTNETTEEIVTRLLTAAGNITQQNNEGILTKTAPKDEVAGKRWGVCSPNPCKNGGHCTNAEDGGFKCICSKSWDGLTCAEKRNVITLIKLKNDTLGGEGGVAMIK